jgi:hypothetical protein
MNNLAADGQSVLQSIVTSSFGGDLKQLWKAEIGEKSHERENSGHWRSRFHR